jgi:macrolide-specific efflux system membrane fusion protein
MQTQVQPRQEPGPRIPAAPRRHVTVPQRISGVLLAVVCVAGAVWYVPRIAAANGRLFSGTVSSSGVSDLNFASPGRVGRIKVSLGQKVKAGQVLVTESAQAATAAVHADRAVITADQANIAGLRAQATAAGLATTVSAPAEKASLAVADAQLAKDEARLASDRLKLQATEIVAPAGGTVVAVNGQVGETVTTNGIRNYAPQSSGSQQPTFSLLPEGPRSAVSRSLSQSALPVIVLRTSAAWQVVVLIPEKSAADVRPGEVVTISVPAANLSGVRGSLQALWPTPVTTSGGVAYQAVVNVLGHQRVTPLSGMAANVRLGP